MNALAAWQDVFANIHREVSTSHRDSKKTKDVIDSGWLEEQIVDVNVHLYSAKN
jgi:hypothetical protein